MESKSLDEKVLERLASQGGPIESSLEFAEEHKVEHKELDGPLKSLLSEDYITLKPLEKKATELTEEAKDYAQNGTPEFRVASLIEKGQSVKKADIKLNPNILNLGLAQAAKRGWVKIAGDSVERKDVEAVDVDGEALRKILNEKDSSKHNANDIANLKKRKLVNVKVIKFYKVEKGSKFRAQRQKEEAELTDDMIKDGSWKDKKFKKFNLNAIGKQLKTGSLHPLMQARQQFRDILLELGFEEMPTSNFVESSFWNFDALFQPQQHPARDMHDTFFIEDPARCKELDKDYSAKVKEVHEKGGYGSLGYRYEWSTDEARKNILRTHTTAVSTRMLYALAQQKEFTPKKYFSIDKVFRNETLDATHLAEFHQIEGLIADRNIGLGHLIGMIQEFFKKFGIENIKFKPAYNPYTEPSMEIFGFHPVLKRWMEIGNSGVFRPEMLRPMGLPEDVSVIAWGLGLERPTMIYYQYESIKELLGHKVQVEQTRKSKIVYFNR